ncbi:MAG: NAD(P)/FAD-dependent oxidoreductase [Methermicoccaceae archaeon]
MEYDLIVVGASPAGMSCALRAAERGVSTLLIDAKDGAKFNPACTFFDKMLQHVGFDIEHFPVIKKVEGMDIVLPSIRITVRERGYVIDRKKFDEQMLIDAMAMGAEVWTSAEVERLVMGAHGAEGVMCDGKQINSKYVVIANGLLSELHSQAGIRPIRHPEDIAWAMEAIIKGGGIGKNNRFEYTLGSIAPGWKATFSPYGLDVAAAGVYVRRHGKDVSTYFEAHLERLRETKGSFDVVKVFEGGDTVAAIPNTLVKNNVLVCGGAAAQSGILYGMRAGILAAEGICKALDSTMPEKKALNTYPVKWKKELGIEYTLGRTILEAIRKMSDEELDRIGMAVSDFNFEALSGPHLTRALKVAMHMLRRDPALIKLLGVLLRR